MDRQRMVRQVVLRGTENGFRAGAAVGTGYGAAVPLALALFTLSPVGPLDELPGTIVFVLYAVGAGITLELVAGSVAGLLFGVLNGVGVALLTATLYSPMHDPHEYRWSVRLTSVLATLLGIAIITLVLGHVPYEDAELVFVGIPLLLTLPCVWVSDTRLAQWYLALADETAVSDAL